MGESVLMAERLDKSFAGRRVLRDVSVSIKAGEIVGLLGPNGAGKTTSFYIIVGLLRPDAGRVTLDGADVTELPMYQRARAGISYLPQEPSVFRKLTVEENILAILETLPISAEERQVRLSELLEELSIAHLAKNKAFSLSGGERRRLEITRALVISPAFMLLDEPFAGIDPIAVLDIQNIVQQLKERGIGVLITDHNVRETLGICDRAYILNEGAILEEGVPAHIAESRQARETLPRRAIPALNHGARDQALSEVDPAAGDDAPVAHGHQDPPGRPHGAGGDDRRRDGAEPRPRGGGRVGRGAEARERGADGRRRDARDQRRVAAGDGARPGDDGGERARRDRLEGLRRELRQRLPRRAGR